MYASYVLLTMLTSAIAYFGFLNASGKVVSDDWNNVQSALLSIFATISINVNGKNESVSEERIAHILKELGLSHLVAELEDGLDTRISENGTGLSEGQKQRFSIARALLLEHPIYLLDEATASLDTVTERVISKAIDRLTAGETRLTIAHRLHTVREADAILVLDKNGQVADYGPHQQLVERNHLYQDFLRGLPQAS